MSLVREQVTWQGSGPPECDDNYFLEDELELLDHPARPASVDSQQQAPLHHSVFPGSWAAILRRNQLAAGQMFIQMSGAPGAGKSTIARAIAARTRAVILDHDVAKSALLNAGIPVSLAGKGSYLVLGALAQQLLQQGHSIIFDSPCFYVDLLERGQRLAREANARFYYIECVVDDLSELDRRLRTRPRQPSQVAGIHAQSTVDSGKAYIDEAVFRDWIANMKRPEGKYLLLDTTRPLEACIDEAMDYLCQG